MAYTDYSSIDRFSYNGGEGEPVVHHVFTGGKPMRILSVKNDGRLLVIEFEADATQA